MNDDINDQLRKLEERITSSLSNRKLDKFDDRLSDLERAYQKIALVEDREQRLVKSLDRIEDSFNKQQDTLKKTDSRIHDRIDETERKQHATSDIVKSAEVRNKTIASVLSIVWLVIGGFTSWAFNASEAKVKEYAEKIDTMERRFEEGKRLLDSVTAEASQVPGLKRRLENLETQIDQAAQDKASRQFNR